MSTIDPSVRELVAPGELRPDLFALLDPLEAATDILLAAPGLPLPYDGWNRIVQAPVGLLSREVAYSHGHALIEQFAQSVDGLPQSLEWYERLRAWASAIAADQVRVRHCVAHALHTRMLSRSDRTILPQAPFTVPSGAWDQELLLELQGEPHQRARTWFEQHFEMARDVGPEVVRALQESWAGELCSARDVYRFVLVRYFREFVIGLTLGNDDNPMLDQLTEFQIEAYLQAKTILARYGGVFLADVVGLGKTFIALALLSDLERRHDEHAVVIAPPSVCATWKALAEEFKLRLATVSIGKLEDLEQYSDRAVVVIDESHNFRNTGTLRYDTLQRWLRPDDGASHRKVLLLSATPQNNHPEDVKNQLALFPNNYARLPILGESQDAWFRDVAAGKANLRDLLQHIIVRRTRRYIKVSFPNARLRVRVRPGVREERELRFPDRISGDAQCLRYALDSTYGPQFYIELLEAIRTMHYPLHSLGRYVTESAQDDPRVASLRRAGGSLRGLFKVLLLKRLESSMVALRETLIRLDAKLRIALEEISAGGVPAPASARSSDEVEELELSPRTGHGLLPLELFKPELQRSVEHDAEVVKSLLNQVTTQCSGGDEKLDRLVRYLKERPPEQHRTLIFTQFTDTANYLAERLDTRFGRTAVTSGSTRGILKIARRFAPKANYADNILPEEHIDLLITTDVLSEGVNLQDADTLINYDLHWNPTRLIQRAGRIDRIGSEHEEIHICSFFPQMELEAALGVEKTVKARIKQFVAVFGEDSNVLPGSERLDNDQVLAAYTGQALQESETDDDLDGLNRHIANLAEFMRNEPDEFVRIMAMRPGRRATSGIRPTLVATQCGRHWDFWTPGREGGRERLDARGALDALLRHAESTEPAADTFSTDSLLMIERARSNFAPLVEQIRQRQQQPRLSAQERFVLDTLERFRSQCPAPKLALLDRLERWVRGGHGQIALRKPASQWKQSQLAAPVVFEEARQLMIKFPFQEESAGEIEVVGSVFGPG